MHYIEHLTSVQFACKNRQVILDLQPLDWQFASYEHPRHPRHPRHSRLCASVSS
jgi:hypothetical protein